MSSARHLIALPASPPSAWATLLFTDIVGSTRHVVELGDAAWRDALEWHDRLVRHQVAASGGRVVKNLGDGYLVAFDDPGPAVDCAHALVCAARAVGVEIRAGLHSGECQVIGDDVVGINVHIAARVCALAEAGQVLGTAAIRQAAGDGSGDLVERGVQELRDVPGRFRLFEAVPPVLPRGGGVLSLC